MTERDMKKLSIEEIKALKDAGKLHEPKKDAPELVLRDEFWETAQIVERENKKSVHLRVDADVFRYFIEETGGKGHIRRMQDVLASYVKAHQENRNPSSH